MEGGVKRPDECCWGLFTCFPLEKEYCFQDEGRKHSLSPAHLLNPPLLSSAPALSASDPGAPCPMLCIKREHPPGGGGLREDQARRTTDPSWLSCRLPYWATVCCHFPPALGAQAHQKELFFFLSPANEDMPVAGPSSCPSLHTDGWPMKMASYRVGWGDPRQGQMG